VKGVPVFVLIDAIPPEPLPERGAVDPEQPGSHWRESLGSAEAFRIMDRDGDGLIIAKESR